MYRVLIANDEELELKAMHFFMERNSKNQLDKHSFPYYDTHNQTRKTVEKEEYIFDRVFTESCRRWDCSMALEMEWTFEGSPEFLVWTDGYRSR